MGEVLLGCSGWNYPDTADKGGWTGVFYPDKDTKRLRYYSQFFNTAEMDSSFYDRFYSQMTKGTFIGMARATPEKFQFSIKVPETEIAFECASNTSVANNYFQPFHSPIVLWHYSSAIRKKPTPADIQIISTHLHSNANDTI
jgi:hypothetical protein